MLTVSFKVGREKGAGRKSPTAGLPAHIAIDLRAVSLAEGFRAALSTAAIVLLDAVFGFPPFMEMALAAWLTCLADAGGPLVPRLKALLTFGVMGALFIAGFGLLRQLPLPIVVPIASLGIFAVSFARVWGQAGLQTGNLLAVVLVLALRAPLQGVHEAGLLAGLFLAGNIWVVLLTATLWRIYPFLPARRAVANCYRRLGLMVTDLRAVLAHPGAYVEGGGRQHWELHARAHRRAVREAIEAARAAVMAVVRSRGPVHSRAAESWIRLETAEQIFGALIGLSDMLEEERDPASRARADAVLRRLRPVLTLLAEYIITRTPERLARVSRAVATMEATPERGTRMHAAVAHIADRLRIAITLAAGDGFAPGVPRDTPPPWRRRVFGPIVTNLDRNSAILLHALRVSAVSVIAFVITLNWPGPYEYWLTITLLVTMQPFFALTFTRALERIGGTVAGGGVGAAIAMVCHTPVALAAAIFPLAMLAFTFRRVSFGLFVAGITPIVVLLTEISQAQGEVHLAFMRAVYILLGGGLAVIGSLVLWPSWEPGRLSRELRAAIAAHGRFARAELSAVLGEATDADVAAARRAAGLASNNVEASLQRVLLEPHGGSDSLEPALTIDAALRRMAGRLSALELDHGKGHDPSIWHAWRDWIDRSAGLLAEGDGALPPRPALPQGDLQADALVRIARQLEIAAGALARLKPA